jgi:hypothetical protein
MYSYINHNKNLCQNWNVLLLPFIRKLWQQKNVPKFSTIIHKNFIVTKCMSNFSP